MNEKERLDLAEWAMKHALASGATDAAVRLGSQRQVEVEFRDKQIDKLQDSQSSRLGLDVYLDHRFSSHSTNDLRKDALGKFIAEAVAATKYLAQDDYRVLPDPKYYPVKSEGDLKIYDPDYGKLETTERVKMASEIEEVAMAQSDKIISATAGFTDSFGEAVQVHSNGFVGGSRGTRYEAGADVTVKDEGGGRPEDGFTAVTRFYHDLPGASEIGKKAVERALGKLGQQKIASGEYDCVIENRAAGRLIRMLMEPLSGRALQQKTSFLDGMLDKQVASGELTIIDDPFLEKGLGSRFFDDDGLAAVKRTVIDKGVLQNYYIDAYYGRKLGAKPTTGRPSNLVCAYGAKSLEELIAGLKKGILVQGFIGGNSNSTTGDFSVGITGVLVEDGKASTPLHEMNISGNTRELLSRLVAMGNDPWAYSPFRLPSMLFEGVHFSGI
jgi:PmbA protein